ncbi:MAG: hypothetical protein J6P66_03600 [Bacteroidaceae bacterium]|nr:hypothetical protein [Bacteroidaceae bacterium]
MDNSMVEMIQNGSYGYRGFSTFGAIFSPTVLPYTIIMILLLVGLCFAAWKAPRWVRPIGRATMILVAFEFTAGLRQLCDSFQWFSGTQEGWSNGYLGIGFRPVLYVAIIGVLIYLISLFISIAQKPRI